MATLKEVKSKISSVKKTKQITSAMKMVATSRLRGSQTNMERFKPYASKFAEVLGSIAGKSGSEVSPLLVPAQEVKKVVVVLCTSDRGLCGGFNINLIEKARKFILSDLQDKEVSFYCFGKKGRDWVRKSPYAIAAEYLDVVGGKIDFSMASTPGQQLIDSFLMGEVDEVYVIYSEFQSMARQEPLIKQVLPIPSLTDMVEETPTDTDGSFLPEHICEPSSDVLLGEMLPKNVFIQIMMLCFKPPPANMPHGCGLWKMPPRPVKIWCSNFRPSSTRRVRLRLPASSWILSVVRKRSRDKKPIYLTVYKQLYLGEKNG